MCELGHHDLGKLEEFSGFDEVLKNSEFLFIAEVNGRASAAIVMNKTYSKD